MTRAQLEELARLLDTEASFALPRNPQAIMRQASAAIRSLLAQEPVMRLNHEGVPKWLPPEFGGGRLPDTPLYAAPVPAVEQEPVAWHSTDWKIIIPAPYEKMWPDATEPLYAAPVPAVDPEWKAEAMRLAEAMRELLELEADGKHADESSIEYWERARAALAAHLDKIGGK